MAVELYGGTIAAFADSMADEIEKALNQVRVEEGLAALTAGDRDRRLLFIAIARGVINHLQKKQEAVAVTVTNGHTYHGHATISVRRPPELP